MEQLRPCPFCGGIADFEWQINGFGQDEYYIMCQDCKSKSDYFVPQISSDLNIRETIYETNEECKIRAVKVWNKRTA